MQRSNGNRDIALYAPRGYTLRQACSMNKVVASFWSWDEFVAYCEEPIDVKFDARRRSRSNANGHDESWWGCTDIHDACAQARRGWHRPNEFMGMVDNIEALCAKALQFDVPHYDVTGAVPDVGLYLGGEPECMIDFVSREVAKPMFARIFVDSSVSWNVPVDVIQRRSAAIVALLDAVEFAGVRVDLDMGNVVRTSTGTQSGSVMMPIIPVKACDEPLDIDLLNFAMVSAASSRMLGFSMRERLFDPATEWSKWRMHDGNYCYPLGEIDEYPLDCDLIMPGLNSGSIYSRIFSSDTETVKWIKETAANLTQAQLAPDMATD